MAAKRHALLIGIREYAYPGADLRGPINDVFVIGTLLRDRFGFPEENLCVLLNQEATQKAILDAFDEMVERIGADDVVVGFYSGHGSRMRDLSNPDRLLETIVPYDSGRKTMPNRDIPDVEIDRWVQRLNEKTPYVTLIFDCCHAGSVTRDPFGLEGRAIEADLRPPEAMFAGGFVPASLTPTPSSRTAEGFRYVHGRRRAVVIAACRAEEEAQEYIHRESGKTTYRGALSHFLGRALGRAVPGATWRDVFETAGPAVTARFSRQHPQIEGDWDQLLFGTREAYAGSYLSVTSVVDDGVTLTGGMAHGVAWGSVWSLHPAGTRQPDAGEELARVRVDSVEVTSSKARFLAESAKIHRDAVGLRAFLRVESLPAPEIRIRIEAGGERAAELRQRVEESTLVDEGEPADVLVRCLELRREVTESDPCPQLGPLQEEIWAAVGTDGRLSVRTRSTDDLAGLVGDLESRARYDRLLDIENGNPASGLTGRVRLRVTRQAGEGSTAAVEPTQGDGLPSLEEGEVVDFEVVNDHDESVWITLLQFGCDGSISRLVPFPGHPAFRPGGHRLMAGEALGIGEYYHQDTRFHYGEGFRAELPSEGFPWAAEPGEDPTAGLVHLKLMVTLEPADFELVEQSPLLGPPDTRDPGARNHPLLDLARLYACGRGERGLVRCSAGEAERGDWTAVSRPFLVRRGVPQREL